MGMENLCLLWFIELVNMLAKQWYRPCIILGRLISDYIKLEHFNGFWDKMNLILSSNNPGFWKDNWWQQRRENALLKDFNLKNKI